MIDDEDDKALVFIWVLLSDTLWCSHVFVSRLKCISHLFSSWVCWSWRSKWSWQWWCWQWWWWQDEIHKWNFLLLFIKLSHWPNPNLNQSSFTGSWFEASTSLLLRLTSTWPGYDYYQRMVNDVRKKLLFTRNSWLTLRQCKISQVTR